MNLNKKGVNNHPRDKVQTGESDIVITKKIKESGNVMDVQLLDHLIITPDDSYFSFADNGLL